MGCFDWDTDLSRWKNSYLGWLRCPAEWEVSFTRHWSSILIWNLHQSRKKKVRSRPPRPPQLSSPPYWCQDGNHNYRDHYGHSTDEGHSFHMLWYNCFSDAGLSWCSRLGSDRRWVQRGSFRPMYQEGYPYPHPLRGYTWTWMQKGSLRWICPCSCCFGCHLLHHWFLWNSLDWTRIKKYRS